MESKGRCTALAYAQSCLKDKALRRYAVSLLALPLCPYVASASAPATRLLYAAPQASANRIITGFFYS